MSWALPEYIPALLPDRGDRLTGKKNYRAWKIRMLSMFQAAGLDDMVLGAEPDDKTENWQMKNKTAKSFIIHCVVDSQLPKIEHCETAAECWKVFKTLYHQIEMGSVVIGIRAMTKPYQNGTDVTKHINEFEAARRSLERIDFDIPDNIATMMLVTTLPSAPSDPSSWNNYISSLKSTTTASFNN